MRPRLGLEVAPVEPGAIWIHAASVGEVGAAEVLWRALNGPRLITADTDAGVARARRFTVATQRRPLDLDPCLSPLWAQARPRAVVFVEGTYWPGLASLAAAEGVPVLRVSCKVGPRTAALPSPVLRELWRSTRAVAARDPVSARLLRRLTRAPVVVLGDLKAGLRPDPSPLRWSRAPIVGASLRGGDPERLLGAWETLGRPGPLLLAPRHPGDLHEGALAGLRWVRRSALSDGAVPDDVDVVWLDTLGELGSCLSPARAAFVGGTFDPAIGGHSPREALAWGVPVVAGPCTGSSGAAFGGAVIVSSPAQLARGLEEALGRPRSAPAFEPVGERVAAFVERFAGAPAPERSPRPWARPWVPAYLVGRALAEAVAPRPRRFDTLVVSVGSDNARSPGRTSTVDWLADRLTRDGHVVGIALRGYGRRRRGLGLSWVDASWQALGDEGAMHAWRGRRVAVAADRREAVAALVAEGCTVVVLDDGLQSVEVARDLDVVVIDARFPRARGLLPAGERRDPWPHRGGVRLAHHGEHPGAIPVRRRPGPWHRGGAPAEPPPGPVKVWLGLGHPSSFLADLTLPVADLRLATDHGGPEGLEAWVGAADLVCSHKDWVRLPPELAARTWHRGVELDVPDTRWLPGPP